MATSSAIAVDLGATSGRFAVGTLDDGQIRSEIIEQIPHKPFAQNGHLVWDLETILGLVKRAAEYGSRLPGGATLGIDAWGVDHGFLDERGELIQAPICYRDSSHAAMFEHLTQLRSELYGLTGIQHQPFNTVIQLATRRAEDLRFVDKVRRWLILPDLIGFLLTGEPHHELTQASTTQLLGLDDRWSARAFELIGWPVPDLEPQRPGQLGGYVAPQVRLATVGSHDTGSAVCGFGELRDDEMFLNVGTWSLVGTVLDRPLATSAAEAANFSNERTVDGRVRFLRNVPGFWVINRLHDELGVAESVPEWLRSGAVTSAETLDLFADDLFNPESMVAACSAQLAAPPTTRAGWAELALRSLVEAIAAQRPVLEGLTGREFRRLRVGGGGSQSAAFCQALATRTGLEVSAGPAEATVVGNLALQFLAQGQIADHAEMRRVITASIEQISYLP
jgi:rhamnulokinase